MQRAAVVMAFAAARCEKFRFPCFGLRESKFRSDGDVRVQFGVQLLDAREHELGELDGRKFAFAEEPSDLFDGGEREIGFVQAQNILS